MIHVARDVINIQLYCVVHRSFSSWNAESWSPHTDIEDYVTTISWFAVALVDRKTHIQIFLSCYNSDVLIL